MNATDALARSVLDACAARGMMLATAESCTGGLIAAALTAIPGSSLVMDRGFVTYSNEAKIEMLAVQPATLAQHGAVSRDTAVEMACGALARSCAGIALSVTGIAGPGGGTAEKPVGLVWFGLAISGKAPSAQSQLFAAEGREAIRDAAVMVGLQIVLTALNAELPSSGSPLTT